MDNFLEINDERQSEAPSSDFSSSEIPSAAPKEQWRTIHGDWLEYRNVNGKILMFCTWCEKAGYKNQMAKGCGTYKKDLIDRHVKNQEHTFLENSRKKNQPSIVQSLSQNLANDKEKVISQMKCVYFIAKNHLSLNLYPELCNLVLNPNKNFETPCLLQLPPFSSSKPSINNTPQYGSYQNSKYARKFEEAIFYVIEKALIDEIKASGKWSILIDESTTITDEKHLVLVSRHIANNVPVLRYLVIDALNDDMNNAENPKERDRTSQLISSLDPNFIISTMFLADLMYILTKMIKMFQRDHIDLSELKHSLETTISAIKAQFIGTEEVSPTYGTILHQYMDDNKILPDNLPSFISKFAKAIIESLKNRFPDSEIYNALRIFDPKFLPQRESDIANYGNNEIKILIEYFGNDRLSATGKKFSAYINETELKQE
ncbi:unnamed protein product [Rhizophagus irregularis]|nr:unnamed protein product [Rhizophagus irregularis]